MIDANIGKIGVSNGNTSKDLYLSIYIPIIAFATIHPALYKPQLHGMG